MPLTTLQRIKLDELNRLIAVARNAQAGEFVNATRPYSTESDLSRYESAIKRTADAIQARDSFLATLPKTRKPSRLLPGYVFVTQL
jgi:hypothetical protein